MKCPNCGIIIPDNMDFCNNCGNFIQEMPKEYPLNTNNVISELFSVESPSITNNSPNIKHKTYNPKVLTIILAICLIIFVALFIIPNIGIRRGITGIDEPVQEETSGYIEKEIGGYEVAIYPQYTYEIEALVVHTKNYYGTSLGNRLSPKDVALAWGKVAEYNDKIDFNWTQSGRWYYWKVKSYDELEPVYGEEYVSSHSSNNHLIPADNSVKRKIKKIKKGDHIKISGYLVTIYAENKSGREFYWDSSTTRFDTGDGACELIYVTDVKWLD